MWRDAASIHQIKIAFVDALQRFVRAQAGTFGDEAGDLRQSLAAMRKTLSEWDLAIQQFQSKASRGPRDAETEIAMATVWLDRHRLDNALRALDAAEQRDARRVDLHTLRALAYGAAGRSRRVRPRAAAGHRHRSAQSDAVLCARAASRPVEATG